MVEQENIQETEVVETEQVEESSLLEEPEETQETSSEEESSEETQEPEQPQESEASRNFRELREKAKRAEKERDEAINVIKQIEQAYYQQQAQQQPKQPQVQKPQEEEITYGDDDLLEGKHLKRERKHRDEEIAALKKQMQQYQQESNERAVESKLTGMYPDFYDVVTKDNIKALREMDPYLADSLHSNPDMMSKAISTYRQIKNNGIVPKENYEPQKQRAKSNTNKPRSTASLSPQQGDSPLSRANAFANGLTPELKQQLYKEMREKAKGY